MSELKHSRTDPGEPGSMQGQIKTPMCSENVGNKGGGKTHDYSKARGMVTKGSNKGGDNLIEGPNWETPAGPTSKAGSNKPGRW